MHNQKGENNNNWKPHTKNYSTIHKWIVRNYGSACKCMKCNTDVAKKYEWALKKGFEHSKDIRRYEQLCTSCHHIYDGHIRNLPSPKLTEKDVKERKLYSGKHGELTQLGKKYGVNYNTIRFIIDRKRWIKI